MYNRRWLLARRPEGRLEDDDFVRGDEDLPDLGPNEVRVRVTHLSYDASQRLWASADSYMPAVPLGAVMRANGVGQVVESNRAEFAPGQLVRGMFGWQDYVQSDGTTEVGPIMPVPASQTPEQVLGVLGITSLTAWFGVHDVLRPKPGQTALVSGAAGATGSVAGQLLKVEGVRVIGVAGGPDKCRWVTQVAGFDACIDYRTDSVSEHLGRLAPDGLNLVYENVGGPVLDAALDHLAIGARVALCGAISGYDAQDFQGLRNYMNLVFKRALIQGFLLSDYLPRVQEAVAGLSALVVRGDLVHEVDLQHGFENIPSTLRRLLDGGNRGKQLLKIADPPLPRVN